MRCTDGRTAAEALYHHRQQPHSDQGSVHPSEVKPAEEELAAPRVGIMTVIPIPIPMIVEDPTDLRVMTAQLELDSKNCSDTVIT